MNYRAGTRPPPPSSAWAAAPGDSEPGAFELQAASLAPLTAAILKARRGSPEPRHKPRPTSSHSQRSRGTAYGGFFSGLSSQPSVTGNLWLAPTRSSGGVHSAELRDGGVPTTALKESIARLHVLQNRLKRGTSEPASERASGGSLRRGLLSPPARKDDVSSGEAVVGSQRKPSLSDEIQSAERALNGGFQKAGFTTPEGEVKRVIRVDEARPRSAADGINLGPIYDNGGPFAGREDPPFAKQEARRHSIGPVAEAPRDSSDAANRRHSSDGGRPASARTDAPYAEPYPPFDSRGVQGNVDISFEGGGRTPGLAQSWTGQKVMWSTQVSRGDSVGEGSDEKRLAATEGNAERQRPISYPDGLLSQSLAGSTTGGSLESLQGRVSSLEAERGPLEGRLYEAIGRMSASMERAFQQRVERLEATMHDAVAEAVAFLGKKATADARTEIEKASADAQMEIDQKLGPAGMERLARRAVWLVGGKMGARATALEAKAARALTVAKRTESQLRQLEATHKLSDGHVSHLTAKIKKLKERVEAAGPPAAAPSCGCAGLCKGLGEGLEGLKKEVRNLEVEAERREMDAERKENESLRRLGELRGEMRDGKADAQFAVLERRVEELEQELGCRTEAELALQRNGEAVAELRKRIDGTEAELASQRNGEAIAELRKRINKMELAQPAEKAIDELKRSQRKSEGELSRLQAEFRSEAAEAGKRNDRNVRAELAKARQEILEEVAGTVEKERESVSRTIADRTADLAESVRRIDGAEADSIKRVEAVEDAHTKLAANVKQQLAEFRDGNGTGKEVEKLRESVEALQSVSDETTERLAEAEEGMEGAKAAATAGLEGLGARIKGLEERVTASIADAQKERKEGTARTGVLQEGLEGLREAVAGLDAAAAAAEPERRKNSERLDGFQKDLEGLQRTVQRLGNSTSAVGETETALGVKALRAELDGVRASVSKIEGAAVDVNALRAELDGVKASVSGFENVAEAVNALRADLDCVNASVSRLEESLSKVEENAGLRSETLSKELSKVRETVAALDAFASEAAAKATLERGESVEARKLLEKRLEELTERVVKCQAEWDGPKSEGVRSLPTDLDGLSDGVKALRADVAKASDGVELLRTDLGGVSDGVDCMRTELDVLKEVLLQLENKVNEAAAKKEVSRGSEAEGSLRDDVAALRGHVAALEASVQEARSAEVEAAGKKESLEEVATRLGYLEAAVEEMRARKSFGDVEGKLREESGRLEASVEALSANGKPETDGRIRESLEGLEARAAAAEAIGKSFASQASVDELRLRLEELEKLGADLQSMKAELDGLRGRHEEFEALRSDVARMEDAVKEAREKVAESGSAEKSDASTGQGLAEVRDRLKALEASLGDLRGREEENEGRLEGMQEQFGELAESVEDAQRKGVEQTEGLERRIAAMAEEGQGVKDSEEELESRVNELQDKVTQLGSSVEELTEQRNEGDSAERERRTDLRVKLIESEADGLKQAVEQLREQQTDSAGNLESVQKQVGDLVSQLSGVTRCPLHDSVEELRARNGDTEHSLEEIRLKLEGLEDDLRRQIGGGHVDQQVERLALAVGKLAETCARDHEALAAGICRHEVGQGAGSKTTSADEGARGKKSGASSIATAVDTERADSGALPDRESIDFAGSRNLVGVLLSGEDSDLEGSPTSPPDVTMTTSFGSPAAEDEPGGAPRAQSWDDIGAQLADVRQSLSGKVGSGSATGSEFSVAAAWATAQSEAGLNPLYELGSTSVEKGAVKEEELGTGASAAAAAPPPSLLMHENLLYQTPISPPSNVTSPADVTTKSSFNSFGGPDRLEPAVGGTGSNGASAPPSGNSVPPSGMPASGTHVPRRPPSLKLDALPGIVPSDLSLRPKSPLGRKSRTQAGFSDKDWSEPPRNAVEVPASLPFARDSLSYLTSPVSPGGGTPRGNRTEFRERRGWAGTEPEKAPSPVCPSPGLANEFLDPKELTPSPSPVDTGSRKPGEFQERTETSTGRSGREGRNRRGSPGSDQSRDSLEGENDVSVLPGEVSGGPPSPGGQSPTAGLSSQGQSKGGRGDESGTRNIDRDFDRAVTSASSAGDVTEKAHAVHGSSARQSPRTESAGRYGPGEDPGEASDSQSDVSEHEVDVGEDEIPEEMDEWDLGVEGLEDVLGSD